MRILKELNYLGHIVTAEGVKPDDRKTEAVFKFPIPKSQKDIKSFLVLAGYYRKFIAGFSAIARPLTDLLNNWSEKQQASFELLKFKLTNAPLLQYPDFNKPFILTTDASGYAIGAVLSQGQLGQHKPIAYASRTRKFQIVTDHEGLTWIFKVRDPSSRLIRWKLLLGL
jgi:hypothetical protein